jgi:hypothetical protein
VKRASSSFCIYVCMYVLEGERVSVSMGEEVEVVVMKGLGLGIKF